MKKLYRKYQHGVPLVLFGIFYLSWFCFLEKHTASSYTIIHLALDDYIPFCEYFVVPYFLWFVYVAGVVMFLFFKDKGDYYKNITFLFAGMTIFLVISQFFPNGQLLRPTEFERSNFFTSWVQWLYQTDTSTNIVPSIHVYNSIGAHMAVMSSRYLARIKWVRIGSLVLCVSICLSTVMLKQHSIFDVFTALALSLVMYGIVYYVPVKERVGAPVLREIR